LHPGVIASDVWRNVPWGVRQLMLLFMRSNEEGAATSIHCATAPVAAAESGLYYDDCRPVPASPLALDPELARALDSKSRAWTGLVPRATPAAASS
jgi:hypothetical protein